MSHRLEFICGNSPRLKRPFHYTACGLNNVYLLSGVKIDKDPVYGQIISIDRMQDLHKVIALQLTEPVHKLMGDEFRFLRKLMGQTQSEVARIMKVDVQTIANYEKKGNIPGPSQQLMRILVLFNILPSSSGAKAAKSLVLDETVTQQLPQKDLRKITQVWKEKAAA